MTGALATVAGRAVFVPAEVITTIERGAVTIMRSPLDLQPFARRPQEVLLKEDVLDRQLINVDGARLVRTNEIELARLEGWYRVVGVDTGHAASSAGSCRAVWPAPSRREASSTGRASSRSPVTCRRCGCASRIRSWRACTRPSSPTSSRRRRTAKAKRSSTPFARTRNAKPTCSRSSTRSTRSSSSRTCRTRRRQAVLARMESDDAADLVDELPEERREHVVELLPPVQRRRVRALLGYDAGTAGGLMSPDFVCVYSQATREEVLDRIRRSTGSADSITWIYVMNQRRRLNGAIQLVDVLRADPGGRGRRHRGVPQACATGRGPRRGRAADDGLRPDGRAGRRPDEQLLGVITVDDVLELVLPRGWRRNFRVFGDD